MQLEAWPKIYRRKNLLISAPTGAGKTEAAMVPVLLSLTKETNPNKGVRAVYITPLRSLNRDMLRRMAGYTKAVGLTVDVRHGDSPESVRRRTLLTPPDLLITTPETLGILLSSKLFKLHLRAVEWIIVDEIHELVNTKRGAHLALSLQRLSRMTWSPPVRIGISATLGNVDHAAKFLFGANEEYAVVADSIARKYDVRCLLLYGDLKVVADYLIDDLNAKRYGTSLVFTNTRDEAEMLTAILREKNVVDVEVHHGSLSREAREEVESKLKEGRLRLVVCTSSLELGIDVGAIAHVYQINSPRQVSRLTQRVGRSLHAVGMKASGTIINTNLDDYMESLALVRRLSRGDLEPLIPLRRPLDVMAHQAAGLAVERGMYEVQEGVSIFKEAYQYRDLDELTFTDVINVLLEGRVLRADQKTVKSAGKRSIEYYFSHASMIQDVENYEVIELATRKKVGYLDEKFVAENMEKGQSLILKGEAWKVVSVDDEKAKIFVERTRATGGAIPVWAGEQIPVDLYTALEVGKIRSESSDDNGELKAYRDRIVRELGLIPDNKHIVVEVGRTAVIFHSCFGTRINNTLEKLVNAIGKGILGNTSQTVSDPYRVLVVSQPPLSGDRLRDLLIEGEDVESLIVPEITSSRLFQYTVWQVAKRFALVDKKAKYDGRAARTLIEKCINTPVYEEALNEVLQKKYDLSGTKSLLEDIRKGRIQISVRHVEHYSVVSSKMIDDAITMGVEGPEKAIENLKERLSKRHIKAVCLTCGRWSSVMKAFEAPEQFRCKLCGSRMIALTSPYDEKIHKIAEKRAKKRILCEEEERAFRKAWKSASLGISFGRRAAIALSCYGVGEDTAARVLRRSSTEEDLFLNLYYAERNFLLYRQYWKA
jgi:ATP-dependent Lhr-like helicase